MTATLLVMRLADMHRVHPRQDNAKVCGQCGVQVGIYPSGQAALRHDPSMQIVCNVCHGHADDVPLAPGAAIEPFESVKRK